MGRDQEKAGALDEQVAAIGQEAWEVMLDSPGLALCAVAVGRRVENNSVVPVPASKLAPHERLRVVDDPADRRLREARQGGIAPRPRNRCLGRVHVDDRPAGADGSQGAAAGVAEEIEDAPRCRGTCRRGPGLRAHPLGDPAPLVALLGEQADLAAVGEPELEGQALQRNLPRIRRHVRARPTMARRPLRVEPGVDVGGRRR